MKLVDVLIVGGGPAGLSAALMLGRCRRQVLVCDAGHYRNRSSYAMFGFLSRDGISPLEFLDISRKQILKYPDVEFKDTQVRDIGHHENLFKALFSNGEECLAKKIILATGIEDEIPDLPGIMDFFGTSIFLCPYCDGWEFRNKPIAVYGQGDRGPYFALLLKEWSSDIVLCTDGPIGGMPEERKKLNELNIPVIEEPVRALEGQNGKLERIIFTNQVLTTSALFFNTPIKPNSQLAQGIGCRVNKRGEVDVDSQGCTSVPGVYAAGDASPDIKLAIIAAAEGTKTAYAVNKELMNGF
jgi:thioredoxin reductase